ncbi:hypothetical protein [Catenuloplanes japonicus]|uniref:hypothetical protein n=1 Tax=Catenuloplanes japonicus TaxID=33876 RepID=UPI0012F7A3CC|nr:hypothetical protein [Catenuloplanes japonicus]
MTSSPGTDQRWNADRKLSFGQLVVGLVSLAVAVAGTYFAYVQVRDELNGSMSPTPRPVTTSALTSSADVARTPGRATGTDAPVYLDSLSPEKGEALVSELPRPLKDAAGYGHALAIACPSNSTGDAVREVSYALSRRYVSVNAVVRPYYEVESDRQSASHVTISVDTRQRDGTMTTRETGAQKSATMAEPQYLVADLEGGDVLTIRVQCSAPTGIIILTEARLSPAS